MYVTDCYTCWDSSFICQNNCAERHDSICLRPFIHAADIFGSRSLNNVSRFISQWYVLITHFLILVFRVPCIVVSDSLSVSDESWCFCSLNGLETVTARPFILVHLKMFSFCCSVVHVTRMHARFQINFISVGFQPIFPCLAWILCRFFCNVLC